MLSQILAATLFSQAALAASVAHPHARFHEKKAVEVIEVEKRTAIGHSFMSPQDVATLNTLKIIPGVNAVDSSSPVWVGDADNAPFVGTFTNASPEDIILVVWSNGNQYVQQTAPLVTHTLQSGTQTQLSFSAPNGGTSNAGAWAAVYPNTGISNAGTVGNTFGEFGFTTNMYDSSTLDISRLVAMNGNTMEIQQGACTANMNTCSYNCPAGMSECWGCPSPDGSPCGTLVNCATGSQPGAAPSADNTAGGCQFQHNTGTFNVTFS